MALTLDPATRIFSSPQSDHTLVSGTLYDVDTDQLRKDMFDLLASQSYIWMPDAYIHNTEVTVAGTTYARTLELINSYQLEFTPNAQWTARLIGSNNNFFDVENGVLVQNQVQVIPTNSAGLINAGFTDTQIQQLLEIWKLMGLDSTNPVTSTSSSITVDDITINTTGDCNTTRTATRV